MKKILKFHPNIDMVPFFDWDSEDDQTLKALPHVIAWYDKAQVAVANDEEDVYNINQRRLAALFQFAKAMPMLFVPASTIDKLNAKKRKRGTK